MYFNSNVCFAEKVTKCSSVLIICLVTDVRQVGFKKGQIYFHVLVDWALVTLSWLNNFRMSKMVEAGGKVIRYVKATLSIFFINLLLKYISSTTYVENNYLNRLKFFFWQIFQRFYWLMASSAQQCRDLPMEYYSSRYRFFSTIGIGIGRRF